MTDWPHSPVHRVQGAGTYMVTAGTYLKRPLFRGPERLRYLCESLLSLSEKYGWQLQAWAVFPNHYHFIALSPHLECGALAPLSRAAASCRAQDKAGASSGTPKPRNGPLQEFIKHLHSITAIQANRWDGTPGRRVWFQYWDTQLAFQKSYLARLNYVHQNAVHHGLVREPSLYSCCSAGWFVRRATPAFYKTVTGMKIDSAGVADDYQVSASDI